MSASFDPRAPVIVGIGQVVQRPGDGASLDPIGLAVEALRRAGVDSGTGDKLLRRADSVRHVATTCWPYSDEGALIADALGARPRQTVRTVLFGGDGPQRLVGETARAIGAGELDVALVSGAEAVASLRAYQHAGETPPWGSQDSSAAPTEVIGSDRLPSNEAEMAVGLMAPIYNYALLETAVRGRTGASPEDHLRSIGELWAGFSEVAAGNPYAWLPEARTVAELTEPSPANRPVSAPYPKLLTANIQVDQASAVILCSAQAALDTGVPRERWVFPWVGTHAHDEWFFSERSELAASPAIEACGRAALEHAGADIGNVALIDLYSCFPSAVQIAAAELGLPLDDRSRPLTVTGGLTFAGGPGNNYSGHGIATLAARLRERPEEIGLATAVGWYATKHAVGLYGAQPPARPFAALDASEWMRRPPARVALADYRGAGKIEAYTVPFAHNGEPEAAIVAALTPDGSRALVRTAARAVIDELLERDALGRSVTIDGPAQVQFEADRASV